jgi:hypothetical protein
MAQLAVTQQWNMSRHAMEPIGVPLGTMFLWVRADNDVMQQ